MTGWIVAAVALILAGAIKGSWGLVLVGVLSPLGVLILRMAYEVTIILFSTRETLADIREEIAYATNRYGSRQSSERKGF